MLSWRGPDHGERGQVDWQQKQVIHGEHWHGNCAGHGAAVRTTRAAYCEKQIGTAQDANGYGNARHIGALNAGGGHTHPWSLGQATYPPAKAGGDAPKYTHGCGHVQIGQLGDWQVWHAQGSLAAAQWQWT